LNAEKAEREEIMLKKIGERLAEGMGFIGGIHSILETFGKIGEKLPPIVRQKLPGFLGLSDEDETIFNQLLPKLGETERDTVRQFLKVLKDYQAKRFIFIVASMEVVAGTPTIIEKKFGKDGKIVSESTTPGKDTEDLRLNFLKTLAADVARLGAEEVRDGYLASRLIMANPFYQKAIDAWSKSVNWFKKSVLDTFEVTSSAELIAKAKQKLSESSVSLKQSAQSYEDKARERYENSKKRRKI